MVDACQQASAAYQWSCLTSVILTWDGFNTPLWTNAAKLVPNILWSKLGWIVINHTGSPWCYWVQRFSSVQMDDFTSSTLPGTTSTKSLTGLIFMSRDPLRHSQVLKRRLHVVLLRWISWYRLRSWLQARWYRKTVIIWLYYPGDVKNENAMGDLDWRYPQYW